MNSLAHNVTVTHITLVRPLSCMEALGKGLLTQLTLIWTFTCMHALMLLEVPVLDERLPTYNAGGRPILSMYLTVALEVLHVLRNDSSQIHLYVLASVSKFMCTTELTLIYNLNIYILVQMFLHGILMNGLLVCRQTALIPKSGATTIACKWLVTCV